MENVNDLLLPLHIFDENRYLECVTKKTDYFLSRLEELISLDRLKAFQLKLRKAIQDAKRELTDVRGMFDLLIHGHSVLAYETMGKILGRNKDVLITPLGKSNAFCNENGMFSHLESKLDKLYLFRGRVVKPYGTYSAEEMYHIPLDNRKNVGAYRYSISGIPCLYLASNSYIVWNEMQKPALNELAISFFELDEVSLNEPIIDLTLPVHLIYQIFKEKKHEIEKHEEAGNYLLDCIPTIPLIIACSVVCDCDNSRAFKMEYLLPQVLMQYVADNLLGIAYDSNRIGSGIMPGKNLAIPIKSFRNGEKFGVIKDYISVSDSLNIGYFSDILSDNSSINIVNKYAKGPSAKKMNYSFSLNIKDAESTFNKAIINSYLDYSYDGLIRYSDSLFYKFDEYLLFMKEARFLK